MPVKRPPNLSDPKITRRKRLLSADELALWDHIASQVRPLRRRKKIIAKPVALPPETVNEPDASLKRAAKITSVLSATVPVTKPAQPPLAPIGRRERSQLSRGRREIDARLDLHGMTQTRAHKALQNFLEQASYQGFTFVLVITGKGRTTGPESERGILRRQVPEWLGLPEFRSYVVGFEEAHIAHGGAGALYIRVRRSRS